jgi:uncharacterized protein YkwD
MAQNDVLDHEGFDKRHKLASDSLGFGKTAENSAANSFVDMSDPIDAALTIVVQWVIDDEHEDRGHRLNLINRDFKRAGAAYQVNDVSRRVNFFNMLLH